MNEVDPNVVIRVVGEMNLANMQFNDQAEVEKN
jgi:hypothetical protein